MHSSFVYIKFIRIAIQVAEPFATKAAVAREKVHIASVRGGSKFLKILGPALTRTRPHLRSWDIDLLVALTQCTQCNRRERPIRAKVIGNDSKLEEVESGIP